MDYYKINDKFQNGLAPLFSADCPHCGKAGTFDRIGVNDYFTDTSFFGQRRCPNRDCLGHIFYISTRHPNTKDLKVYPPLKINFSKEGIPNNILKAFEEAITCHSTKCYVASAIMLRKTLEEICQDQNAKGGNLYQRLQNLASIIVVPNELIEAMNELRLLGNDAAHLEAQTYEEIGQEEIESR